MRTLIVFAFVFTFTMFAFWGCCAFVTAVPNPMDWAPVGRFMYCLIGGLFSFFCALGAAVSFEEKYG